MITNRNLEKTFTRYAEIRFELQNTPLVLTAFKSNMGKNEISPILFIPFKDGTTGNETYPAGRFLEIPEPRGVQFVLEFNQCFNPLCNYSLAYNCPVPPPENHLSVPIPAGEKTYPH